MRVNEGNFAAGDVEDVEPSYVEQVLGNHNQDGGAHPDIRKLIQQTQAFYQGAKDSVAGIAEAARNSAMGAAESANFAADEAIVASDAKAEAVAAKVAAESAAETAKMVHPTIVDGEWYLYSSEENCLAPSGVMATGLKGEQGEVGPQGEIGPQGETGADGKTPARGVDYWTDEDKAQIVADVLEALPAAEEVAY